jgi:hypothetical protein
MSLNSGHYFGLCSMFMLSLRRAVRRMHINALLKLQIGAFVLTLAVLPLAATVANFVLS